MNQIKGGTGSISVPEGTLIERLASTARGGMSRDAPLYYSQIICGYAPARTRPSREEPVPTAKHTAKTVLLIYYGKVFHHDEMIPFQQNKAGNLHPILNR